MNSTDTVEVALLKVHSYQVGYYDTDNVISRMLDDVDWFSVTRDELKLMQVHSYDIAKEFGVDNIIILEKANKVERETTLIRLREILAVKVEAARKLKVKQAAAQKRANETEEARKLERARKNIEKNQRILDAAAKK